MEQKGQGGELGMYAVGVLSLLFLHGMNVLNILRGNKFRAVDEYFKLHFAHALTN